MHYTIPHPILWIVGILIFPTSHIMHPNVIWSRQHTYPIPYAYKHIG